MLRNVSRVLVLVAVIGFTALAWARSNQPPLSRTGALGIGAFPAENTCNLPACHAGSPLNEAGGLLEILDVPASFLPNQTYPIRVRLAHTYTPPSPNPLKWGFELCVVRADSGTSYGSFATDTSLDVATVTSGSFAGRRYVRHLDLANHVGDFGPVEWSFSWTAPSYIANKIYFFAAGNAANGNLDQNGDKIYTASDSTYWDGVIGVPAHTAARTEFAPPAPNPSSGPVSFNYSLAREGNAELALYDLHGRNVRTLFSGLRPAGPSYVTWDGLNQWGSSVPAGVYFARLVAPGAAAPIVRKVTISD